MVFSQYLHLIFILTLHLDMPLMCFLFRMVASYMCSVDCKCYMRFSLVSCCLRIFIQYYIYIYIYILNFGGSYNTIILAEATGDFHDIFCVGCSNDIGIYGVRKETPPRLRFHQSKLNSSTLYVCSLILYVVSFSQVSDPNSFRVLR